MFNGLHFLPHLQHLLAIVGARVGVKNEKQIRNMTTQIKNIEEEEKQGRKRKWVNHELGEGGGGKLMRRV